VLSVVPEAAPSTCNSWTVCGLVQFTQCFEVVTDVMSRFMTRDLSGHDCSYQKHFYCRIWQYMATKGDMDVHHAAGKNVFGCPCIPDIPEWRNLHTGLCAVKWMYWQSLHFQGDNLVHMDTEVDGKNKVHQLWRSWRKSV
jgi:hypothetical protein